MHRPLPYGSTADKQVTASKEWSSLLTQTQTRPSTNSDKTLWTPTQVRPRQQAALAVLEQPTRVPLALVPLPAAPAALAAQVMLCLPPSMLVWLPSSLRSEVLSWRYDHLILSHDTEVDEVCIDMTFIHHHRWSTLIVDLFLFHDSILV